MGSNAMSNGDEVEAIAPSPMELFWNRCQNVVIPRISCMALLHHANFEYSLAASYDDLANSRWNVWQCDPRDTEATAQEVRIKAIVDCSGLSLRARWTYCQINWISLAVVGGCTALFMVGAILAYDPSPGFLARRGEPGGGT
jgi:hypothetical protein